MNQVDQAYTGFFSISDILCHKFTLLIPTLVKSVSSEPLILYLSLSNVAVCAFLMKEAGNA